MWPFASPPSYPGFNAPRRRSDRAAAIVVTIAVALLFGAGLGGASVFAIVAALTTAPNQPNHPGQEVGVATADKTAENRRPAGDVAAKTLPDPSPGAAAGAGATTMTAAIQPEDLANQAQITPPSTTASAEQAQVAPQVTPPAQPVKPWPDALSRAHRAEAETAAPDQTAAARSAAPPAATSERDSADRSLRSEQRGSEQRDTADHSQRSERREANGKNASGKTADRAISENRERQPPNNFNEADRRSTSPSRDAHRAGVEPRERDDGDEGDQWREHAQWRDHDQWRGGFFGLFSRGGNWRDRGDTWADDRED